MHLTKQILLLLLLFCCTWTPTRSQNLYYVNDASTTGDVYSTAVGNDVNNGTSPGTPKLTVQSIIDNYNLGGSDTIFIDAGTYLNQMITIGSVDDGSGTPSAKYMVLKGAGSTKTFFQNSSAFGQDNVSILEAEYIRIQGISFQNSGTGKHNIYKQEGDYSTITNCEFIINATSGTGVNIYFKATDGVSKLNSNYCNISNNRITNSASGGRGVFFEGNCDYSLIASNRMDITGSSSIGLYFLYATGGGFHFWPIYDTIRSNTINASGTGIYLLGGTTSDKRHILTGYTIEKNTITITGRAANNVGLDMENTGDFAVSGVTQDPMYIKKNHFIGGYSGIICSGYTRSIVTTNNYFCKPDFGMRVDYWDGADSESYFVHNTVYSYKQCMVFDSYFSQGSQYKWRIRNNIFLTLILPTAAPVDGQALFFYGNEQIETSDYNLFSRPNNAWVANYNGSNYDRITWPGLSSPDPTIAFGGVDANSLLPASTAAIPNFQDTANCDLDLLVDNTNYPTTGGYPTAVGGGLPSILTDDIKSMLRHPSSPTIGAFESTSTLPFELIEFNLKKTGNDILLQWTSSNEQEIKYYEIEKSMDGKSWVRINRTSTLQYNRNGLHEYHFTDLSGTSGNIYYRINAINHFGKQIGSAIRNIKVITSGKISIFPNPAKGKFTITGLSEGITHEIQVIDVNGKVIKNNRVIGGFSTLQMNDAAPGIYYIRINGANHISIINL